MRTSLKVTICFMTAAVSLFDRTGSMEKSRANCEKLTLKAHQGGSVTINCKYPAEENILKKFCKENENSQCTSLLASHMANLTVRGRFSLIDNVEQQEFTVTISALTQDDAGTYQCAMMNMSCSYSVCLTEIQLEILPNGDMKNKKSPHNRIPPNPFGFNDNRPKKAMIGGILGCLALLVVGLLAIVIHLVKQKTPYPTARSAEGASLEVVPNNTEGNRDNEYEEIQISRNEQDNSTDVQSVHADDNPLHYSTIDCQRNSVTVLKDGDVPPTAPDSLACDYSFINTITCPPTAETTMSSATEMPGEP